MNETLRQKRVASLIQEILSGILLSSFRNVYPGLVSITQVDLFKDLRQARVYLSFFGGERPEVYLRQLNDRSGTFRKAIASHSKLKYNPKLIFFLDPGSGYEKRIDKILNDLEKDGQ